MKFVLDANILIAALIKQGYASQIILSRNYTLIISEYLIDEIRKHEQLIIEKANYTNYQFNEIFTFYLNRLRFIHITEKFILQAKLIAPDPDDTHYFATALQLNIPILSNDKRLKEQNVVKVIALHELE